MRSSRNLFARRDSRLARKPRVHRSESGAQCVARASGAENAQAGIAAWKSNGKMLRKKMERGESFFNKFLTSAEPSDLELR